MNVNEKWYARLPGSNKVQAIQIKEITQHTILIEDLTNAYAGFGATQSRYALNVNPVITFIEQLPDNYEYTYANTN